jgi:hypothetical protein
MAVLTSNDLKQRSGTAMPEHTVPENHHQDGPSPDETQDQTQASETEDGSNQDDTIHCAVIARVTSLPVPLGQVMATPGALDALATADVTPLELLRRHALGDWGEVDAHDKQANDRALLEGTRLLSAYTLPITREKVWIITEWDRSVTTLLLPSEY